MARILVVEDERVVAWHLQEALRELGHTVLASVASAGEAIRTAAATLPDLVLMDIRLKGELDGIAAAEHIRDHLDIPVIYLTAHADDRTLQRAIATDPFGYLVKPFQERELHTTIAITLRRHELARRSEAARQTLTTTLEHTTDATLAITATGQICYVNPRAATLLGCEPPDVLGQPVDHVITLMQPDTLEAINNPLLQAIQTGSTVQLPPCLLGQTGGQSCPISGMVTPIKNGSGRIIGAAMVFQDLGLAPAASSLLPMAGLQPDQESLVHEIWERTTHLHQAIACLQVLKRVFNQLHHSSDETQILQIAIQELGLALGANYCWVTLYDSDLATATITGQYVGGHPHRYPNIVGTEIELQAFPAFYMPLLQGKSWLFPAVDTLPSPYQPILANQDASVICPICDDHLVIGEVGVLLASELPWSELQADLISQVVSQCAATLRQVHLYQMNQSYGDDLNLLEELREEFFHTMSDELRPPLHNMKAAVDILQQVVISLKQQNPDAPPAPSAQMPWQQLEHCLQILQAEWQKESGLISDLLDLRDADLLIDPLPLSLIDLTTWLPQMMAPFVVQAASHGQTFSCSLSPHLTDIVSHRPSLERVVTEMLKYICGLAPASGQMGVTAEVKGNNLELKALTTGIELTLAQLEQVFQPFPHLTAAADSHHSMTDLGLALARQLTVRLGGKLWAQSDANATALVLLLPMMHEPFERLSTS